MSRIVAILFALCVLIGALAQDRTVNPVVPVTSRPLPPVKEPKQSKPEHSARPASVIEVTDDLGNSLFLDTISGNEWVDSMALAQPKVIGNIYPLWDAVSVGVDAWPALGRAFGQKQGLVGFWGRLSLHNRFFPVFEAGISSAATTPAEMSFTYRQPLAPYFKIGLDYNFFYNSNPDYQVFALLRYGLSHFRYYVDDVTLTGGYWDTTDRLSLPPQSTTTGNLEIGAGIVVKIWGPFSAGWNIRYHKILHHSAETYGAPWSVPGFGTRTSELGVQLSLIYTIPLHSPIPDPSETNANKK